ncbi:MAG: glycosyltransferase family 39 protein [Endomicrobiia bacterium]
MKYLTSSLILIFLILRIISSLKFQLHPDETYYWLWSERLDFSYFDHPPMVAYIIKLTTLFKNTEFFVRFSSIVFYIIFNFFLYKLVKKFFNKEVAYLTIFIFNIFPLNSLGFIITPDIPLLFFTILFLYFLIFAFEENRFIYWILVGIFGGFALLSKYNGILLIICMFLSIIFIKEYRKYFFSLNPYISLILSFLIFLPVIIWNYDHNWISFKYQFFHGLPQKSGSLNNIITYIAGQISSLGIFLGIICFYVLFRSIFIKDKKIKFFSIFGFFPILFFGLTSYKNVAEMNWPLCAYPAVSLLVANYFVDKQKLKKIFLFPSSIFCLIIILIMYLHGLFRIIPLEKINPVWTLTDPTNWFYGWKEFTEILKKENLEYPIFTTNHQLACQLLYYSNKNLNIFYNEQQFYIWNKDENIPDKFYFINYESDVKTPSPQQKNFKSQFVKSFNMFRKGYRIRTYNLFLCTK